MRSIHKYKKGFTLIEMLIVIVIIGILAAALVPRLQSVQSRARDTERKADLNQILNGLHIYKLDNGSYPTPPGGLWYFYVYSYQLTTGSRISQLSGILTSVPRDPINASINTRLAWWYSYAYWNVYTPGNSFTLFAKLESSTDPERCQAKWTRAYINGVIYI